MSIPLLDATLSAVSASISGPYHDVAISCARAAAFAFVAFVVPMSGVPRLGRLFLLVVLCGGVASASMLRFGSWLPVAPIVAGTVGSSAARLEFAGRIAFEILLGGAIGLAILGVLAAVRVGIGFVADAAVGHDEDSRAARGFRLGLRSLVDLLALSAIFASGLHLSAIEFIVESFERAPVGSLRAESWESLGSLILATMLPDLLIGGLVLAAPIVTCVLALSAIEGFLGRVLPERAVSRLAPTVRIALVIFAFGVVLPRTAGATRAWCHESLDRGVGWVESVFVSE